MSRLDYASPDRINPYRLYFPGHSYTPDDLVSSSNDHYNPYDPIQPIKYPRNKQAFLFGDFKNVEFLRLFIGDAGRIKPRRITGLRGPAQRRVVRSINSARQLALLNPCSRHPIPDFYEDSDDDEDWDSEDDSEDDYEDDYEDDSEEEEEEHDEQDDEAEEDEEGEEENKEPDSAVGQDSQGEEAGYSGASTMSGKADGEIGEAGGEVDTSKDDDAELPHPAGDDAPLHHRT